MGDERRVKKIILLVTIYTIYIYIYEDYDWEQDRMIRYRMNDKGGIEPKGYDS